MLNGTDTIFFMHPSQMPKNKKIAYVHLVSSIRPLKSETHRVRVTIGGNRLECDGITATTPTTQATVKTHLKSTISTANAKHITLDFKKYYYGTPISEHECSQMPLSLIPTCFRQ